MVRNQESIQSPVGMTPARREGRSGAFDALAALDAVKTPILVVASDGRVDFLNVAARELLRVPGGDLVGTDLRTALPWLAEVVFPGGPGTAAGAGRDLGGAIRSHVVNAPLGTPDPDAPAVGAPLVV